MTASVVCIGGATVDRKLRLSGPFVAATSNPVFASWSYGGVARNVAETLARLGVETALVSAVGDDAAGDAVTAHLATAGVDTAGVVRLAGMTTAQYDAVLSSDGALVAGFAAMEIFAAITEPLVTRARVKSAAGASRFTDAAWIFADANLPRETLAALPSLAGAARIAVDAVSVVKSARLSALLPDLMFLNGDEAAAILGARQTPQTMAAGLCGRAARAVVLTIGAEGALIADAGGVRRVPATPAVVADVTGAGDALVAGTLAGLVEGMRLDEAVGRGTRVAARTIESRETVRVDIAAVAG